MVIKKTPKSSKPVKKTSNNAIKRADLKRFPTLKIKTEKDIAMDFAEKVYQKFDKMIKAVVLFGSTAKKDSETGSDIDIIIIVDDATVRFDSKLIMWYREELGKIIQQNPYRKDFHINTIKLTTWWQDISKGDPTAINIVRYGKTLIDFGGFFRPIKILLQEGKIRPSPEAIYASINRAPEHIIRSRIAEMSAIEGCYWAMVDSAQAVLMALKLLPPSPEKIPFLLKEHVVDKGLLKRKYIDYFNETHELHKDIIHGKIKNLDGRIIDNHQERAEDFFKTCIKIIDDLTQ